MILISGVEIRDNIEAELKEKVAKLDKKPCLAVIQVGDNQASNVYVRNKERACERVGIDTKTYKLPEDTTEEGWSKRSGGSYNVFTSYDKVIDGTNKNKNTK